MAEETFCVNLQLNILNGQGTFNPIILLHSTKTNASHIYGDGSPLTCLTACIIIFKVYSVVVIQESNNSFNAIRRLNSGADDSIVSVAKSGQTYFHSGGQSRNCLSRISLQNTLCVANCNLILCNPGQEVSVSRPHHSTRCSSENVAENYPIPSVSALKLLEDPSEY